MGFKPRTVKETTFWLLSPAHPCQLCKRIVTPCVEIGSLVVCPPCAVCLHAGLEALRQGNPFDWPPKFEVIRTDYLIGYSVRKDLLGLVERFGYGRSDREAIERLFRGAGTRSDVEACAALYEQAGEGANAAALRRGCYGPLLPS